MFAVECLMKIISACEGGEGQFDLQLAKELKEKTGKSEPCMCRLFESALG